MSTYGAQHQIKMHKKSVKQTLVRYKSFALDLTPFNFILTPQ